jgi:hypothetical protein
MRNVNIAAEQKNLAVKLESQTNKIIRLTWALLAFSVALLAVSLVTVKIMFKEDAKTNVPQINGGQNQTNFSTNK